MIILVCILRLVVYNELLLTYIFFSTDILSYPAFRIGNFPMAASQIPGLEFLPLLNFLAAGSAIFLLLLKKPISYHKRRHSGIRGMTWEDTDASFFVISTTRPISFHLRLIYTDVSISGGLPSSQRAWKSQLLIPLNTSHISFYKKQLNSGRHIITPRSNTSMKMPVTIFSHDLLGPSFCKSNLLLSPAFHVTLFESR